MSDQPIRTNKRKATCSDCKRLLQAGEGVAHRVPMTRRENDVYYLCPGCDKKRKERLNLK